MLYRSQLCKNYFATVSFISQIVDMDDINDINIYSKLIVPNVMPKTLQKI